MLQILMPLLNSSELRVLAKADAETPRADLDQALKTLARCGHSRKSVEEKLVSFGWPSGKIQRRLDATYG
jgi:hypothetical protein